MKRRLPFCEYENTKNKRQKHYHDDDDENEDDECVENNCHRRQGRIYAVDNHIYYHSPVTPSGVDRLIELIYKKNKDYDKITENKLIANYEPMPIYLHITSYGGCLLSGLRAVDAITSSQVPVHTVIDGYAASAATLMSVVGKRRYMTRHSYLLIHQLSSGLWGKYSELEDDYHNCKTMMNNMYEIYEKYTDMKRDDLKKQMSRDIWWRHKNCIKNGFIDEVWN